MKSDIINIIWVVLLFCGSLILFCRNLYLCIKSYRKKLKVPVHISLNFIFFPGFTKIKLRYTQSVSPWHIRKKFTKLVFY